MEDLRKTLSILKKREIQLIDIIKNHSFLSEEEYNSFVKEKIDIFIELKNIKMKIKDIEWSLMSNEDRKNYLKYLEKLRKKFN